MGYQSAEAGGCHGHIRSSISELEPLLYDLCLRRSTKTTQTFVVPMQTPYVIGMLSGTAEGVIVAQVCPINPAGLFQLTLLQKKGTERVACWLHPPPWFLVEKIVVKFD